MLIKTLEVIIVSLGGALLGLAAFLLLAKLDLHLLGMIVGVGIWLWILGVTEPK